MLMSSHAKLRTDLNDKTGWHKSFFHLGQQPPSQMWLPWIILRIWVVRVLRIGLAGWALFITGRVDPVQLFSVVTRTSYRSAFSILKILRRSTTPDRQKVSRWYGSKHTSYIVLQSQVLEMLACPPIMTSSFLISDLHNLQKPETITIPLNLLKCAKQW